MRVRWPGEPEGADARPPAATRPKGRPGVLIVFAVLIGLAVLIGVLTKSQGSGSSPGPAPGVTATGLDRQQAINLIYDHNIAGTGRTAGGTLRELMDAAGNVESQWDAQPEGGGYRVTALLTEHGSSKTLSFVWKMSSNGSFCAVTEQAANLTPDVPRC